MTGQLPMSFGTDPYAAPGVDIAGPIHWPSIPPEDLPAAFDELRDWVHALIDRFAIDRHVIPPCWEHHNAMVETLSALRDHERLSYTDTAPATAAVDFIRALRDTEVLLHDRTSRIRCTAGEHHPDADTTAPAAL